MAPCFLCLSPMTGPSSTYCWQNWFCLLCYIGLVQEGDPGGSEVGWGLLGSWEKCSRDNHGSGHFGPLELGRCPLWRVEPLCSEVSWIYQVLGSGQIPQEPPGQWGRGSKWPGSWLWPGCSSCREAPPTAHFPGWLCGLCPESSLACPLQTSRSWNHFPSTQ